ncbi:hypothetical protein [Pseudanabaena sp. ABRG5-3]|jgi:hypothetical protein|uniref:hypothetical protein n=1 Tax=Pseudanabaena sp. ABRG5-3 TaxID=685565 RepID=UPI000DC6DF3A|nr:hypothetical protein [Pseudanabaena sp. ABRG5-3]BBC24771.1 hypothetical protein ABRG53_2514 [Pseudanabaena sp. ABRG5-3]
MATKLEDRFIPIGSSTGAALKFRLDPEIYNATIGTILGVAASSSADEIIPITKRLAGKSTAAQLLKVTVRRGTGDDEETRQIELICDKQSVTTAKDGSTGLKGKTLKLGGVTTRDWTVISVV